ncbi:MAG: hypothetical protein AAGI03_17460, partial [Pseudomonadota bacterium]
DDVQLMPGDSATFEFEAGEALQVKTISYTLNGFSASDLLNVSFGVNIADQSLSPDEVEVMGNVANGATFQTTNLVLQPGDTFSIVVDDGVVDLVDFDFTFVPTAIPLPPGFLLLGSALLGAGIYARRKAA